MSDNTSEITKKYKRLSMTFGILSIAVTILPVVYYVVLGFVEGGTQQKATLGMTVTVAVVLTAVNVLFKKHIRSTIWVLVLGIYICLKNILPLLLMVAIGTILDEFVLSPLHKAYKQKATINKEIDKRIINNGQEDQR